MLTSIVIIFAVAFSASAVVLLLLASFGFGQGVSARITEGIGGLLLALAAAGVPFANSFTIWWLLWFILPAAALSNVLRIRGSRQLHEDQLAATYAAEAAEADRTGKPAS